VVLLISIITCTYKTDKNVLARTWASIKAQTYKDWEWVVYDDSPGLETYNQIYGFCSDERFKIRLFRPHVPSDGMIGMVKRNAFMMGEGNVLVELDHDDELTPDALELIAQAYESNKNAGFYYSDCCELFPNGESGRYPEGWGLGYGSDYWDEEHSVWAMRVPLNRKTLSHIVSMPNHVRAWRADIYRAINGHDPNIPIADDYELMVRTAIATDFHHIPKMLYKQHIGPETAQRTRNSLIQELVPQIHNKYSQLLDEKFGKLD